MNYFKFILSTCVVGLLVSSTFSLTRTQVKDADVPDLVEQKVGPLVLNNEYFVEGLARLNMQTNGIGFAVEFLPGTTTSAPPPDLRFTTENEAGTVKHALDWLCSLDPRYTWKLEGRTINIIPRDRVSDPNYLFN